MEQWEHNHQHPHSCLQRSILYTTFNILNQNKSKSLPFLACFVGIAVLSWCLYVTLGCTTKSNLFSFLSLPLCIDARLLKVSWHFKIDTGILLNVIIIIFCMPFPMNLSSIYWNCERPKDIVEVSGQYLRELIWSLLVTISACRKYMK